MKRILMALMALLLLAPAALADTMAVVNCDEWVSLRERPSTQAARLEKVPLYAWVEDCEDAENGFMRVTYDGKTGYILSKYLEPVEQNEPDMWLEELANGCQFAAQRRYIENSEQMTVCFYDADGVLLWTKAATVQDPTELTMTDAFLGGTAEAPRVMLYSAEEGLMSLDPDGGEAVWTLTPEQVNLGAGNAHAVDGEGRMAICGYYGPDPVCIDRDGNVLWKADAGSDDIYWPYAITLTDEGAVTEYEMMGEGSGRIVYDMADGHVVRSVMD